MGKNVSATRGQPVFNIQARPYEHNNAIQRQGQWCRMLRAAPCTCVRNGQPQLDCVKCFGKGATYSYQRTIRIYDENSHHGRNDLPHVIKTDYIPIAEVFKVLAINSLKGGAQPQGILEVDSFNDEEIYLSNSNQYLPNDKQRIAVSYSYLHWDYIEETIKGNGTWIIEPERTKFNPDRDDDPDAQFIPSYNEFRYDIAEVVDCSVPVAAYYKHFIELKQVNPNDTPPDSNTDITIKYFRTKPHPALINNLSEMQMQRDVAFSDFKQGDVSIQVQSWIEVGGGDIVTLLATPQRQGELRVKSSDNIEELSEFDVKRILEFIVDEDGVKYTLGVDYQLYRMNYVKWISNKKPATNKKYAIVYYYYPTYILYDKLPEMMGNENKEWPTIFFARKYQRLFNKQAANIVNQFDMPENANGSVVNDSELMKKFNSI